MSTSNPIRDYLSERNLRIKTEWKLFQQSQTSDETLSQLTSDSDLKRLYHGSRHYLTEQEKSHALQSQFDQILHDLKIKNTDKHEPFEYFTLRSRPVPPTRDPSPGITLLPLQYHIGQIVTTTETVTEQGFPLDPLLTTLLTAKYPQYLAFTQKYCRPLGTTESTFVDFNKPQIYVPPSTPERKERILKHIFRYLNAKPYLPVHFVDTLYAGLPISTGTGYHNRHSYKIKAHARYSHPKEYATKPTSKGYFLNAFLEQARTIVHRIKSSGLPFQWNLPNDPTDQDLQALYSRLNSFINEYPTLLFTRNHISDRDGKLKQRPVYAADELFLTIETMLTFPLLVQARNYHCCIMYGLETIRGSNVYLDALAQLFKSFFTIDWSAYDQSLPRTVTSSYYEDFLPRLIVINQAYQPTYEYPTYPDLTEHDMYSRMRNLLSFLHCWYNNMTFLSQDGFAYRRQFAGVPSGILNTQYIDSYGNLYLIIDAFIEFKLTDHEIEDVLLFIMGDDNSGFTHWSITKLEQFLTFLTEHAKTRWNMTISPTKSVTTTQRQYIETLSYKCNFGKPLRPLPKLVAQLCYPEHGMIYKFMSYRAIGIAYAACAMDVTFHNFCKDVYYSYLPYQVELTPDVIGNIVKFLPGQFKMLDSYVETLDLSKFPTLENVANTISKWQGPLSFSPKWNFAHFIHAPDTTLPHPKTMKQYEDENDLIIPPPPEL
uniref:RNA-dependent RNA polymerase n=1 Tax=Bremia lactucae associated partitivirus 1 TaxID=2719811 RepID=A0A6G9ELK4_9VIRU|nr:MAG: RNA-dependent RNA polymerase [Bremia lactucae associated partitivirus 1]